MLSLIQRTFDWHLATYSFVELSLSRSFCICGKADIITCIRMREYTILSISSIVGSRRQRARPAARPTGWLRSRQSGQWLLLSETGAGVGAGDKCRWPGQHLGRASATRAATGTTSTGWSRRGRGRHPRLTIHHRRRGHAVVGGCRRGVAPGRELTRLTTGGTGDQHSHRH